MEKAKTEAIIGIVILCLGFSIMMYGLWISIMIPVRIYLAFVIMGIGGLLLYPGMILFYMGLFPKFFTKDNQIIKNKEIEI